MKKLVVAEIQSHYDSPDRIKWMTDLTGCFAEFNTVSDAEQEIQIRKAKIPFYKSMPDFHVISIQTCDTVLDEMYFSVSENYDNAESIVVKNALISIRG